MNIFCFRCFIIKKTSSEITKFFSLSLFSNILLSSYGSFFGFGPTKTDSSIILLFDYVFFLHSLKFSGFNFSTQKIALKSDAK